MTTEPANRDGGTQHLPLGARGLALVLTCTAVWGGQAIAAKVSVEGIPAIVVLGLRLALALPILLIAAYGGHWRLRLRRRQWLLVAGNTLLVLLQIGLFLVGTGMTSSARSIVIVNTFPLFAALAARLLTNDARLQRREAGGLLIAFIGLQVVLLPRLGASLWHQEDIASSLIGDGLVLLSAALIGFKIAYLRRILAELNPLQSVFWSSLLGAIVCGIGSVTFYNVQEIPFSLPAVAAIGYQGLLVSGIAVLIWTYLLSQHPINKLTVFRLLTPPIGIFFSWLILSDELSAGLLSGAALIAIGIGQVNKK